MLLAYIVSQNVVSDEFSISHNINDYIATELLLGLIAIYWMQKK